MQWELQEKERGPMGRYEGGEAEARLQAVQAKAHPALWEDEHKLLFVRCVSDEPELTKDASAFSVAHACSLKFSAASTTSAPSSKSSTP